MKRQQFPIFTQRFSLLDGDRNHTNTHFKKPHNSFSTTEGSELPVVIYKMHIRLLISYWKTPYGLANNLLFSFWYLNRRLISLMIPDEVLMSLCWVGHVSPELTLSTKLSSACSLTSNTDCLTNLSKSISLFRGTSSAGKRSWRGPWRQACHRSPSQGSHQHLVLWSARISSLQGIGHDQHWPNSPQSPVILWRWDWESPINYCRPNAVTHCLIIKTLIVQLHIHIFHSVYQMYLKTFYRVTEVR